MTTAAKPEEIERRAARLAELITPLIAAELAIAPVARPEPDERAERLMRACHALGTALDRFDQSKHTANEGITKNQVIRAARQLKRVMEKKRHDR